MSWRSCRLPTSSWDSACDGGQIYISLNHPSNFACRNLTFFLNQLHHPLRVDDSLDRERLTLVQRDDGRHRLRHVAETGADGQQVPDVRGRAQGPIRQESVGQAPDPLSQLVQGRRRHAGRGQQLAASSRDLVPARPQGGSDVDGLAGVPGLRAPVELAAYGRRGWGNCRKTKA